MSRLLRAVLPVVLLGFVVAPGLPAAASRSDLAPPPIEHYPDVAIAAPYEPFYGRETRELARRHGYLVEAGQTVLFRAEVCNRTGRLGRITLRGTPSGTRFKVRYVTRAGTDITRAVVAGTYGLRLAMDTCARYRIVVRRTVAAVDGNVRTFVLAARPADPQAYVDRVGAVVHAAARAPHGPCVPDGQGGLVCP